MRRLAAKDATIMAALEVQHVGFTIGTEGGNIINVALQLQNADYANIATRGHVLAYLSGDSHGDSLLTTAPTGGVVIGTDGVLLANPATDGIFTSGAVAVDATAEKWKTTATIVYSIGTGVFTKTAATAQVFSSAYTVNLAASGQKWGAFLLQVNAAGTFSTKAVSADQAYSSEALAIAALPVADAGKIAIGYITVQSKNNAAWTANTDDMTAASDLAAVNLYNSTALTSGKTFSLISESNGHIDINITESGVKTMYLAVRLPSGNVEVSGAITFA